MLSKDMYDYMLLYVAEVLISNDSIKSTINHIYNTDKIKYYNRAKQSAMFENRFVTIGSIEREQNIKRAFGILLYVKEDEIIKDKLKDLLDKYFPAIFREVKRKSKNLKEAIGLLNGKYITEGNKMYRHSNIIAYFSIDLLFGDMYVNESFEETKALIEKELTGFKENEEIKKIYVDKEKANSVLERIYENYGNVVNIIKDIGLLRDFMDYNTPVEVDYELASKTQQIYMFPEILSEIEDTNLENLLTTIRLDDEDLLNITFVYYDIFRDRNLERSHLYFVFGVILISLLKAYKEAKLFYRNNNAETQFLELSTYQKKVLELEQRLSTIAGELNKYRKESNEWDNRLKLEISRIDKQNKSDAKELNKEIDRLNKELEQEKAKSFEVNKLREFAFSIKNEYIPKETGQSFEDTIKDKKIVVIGGHQNWRNKFKEQYPDITIIDGFNDGFDIKLINQADFVFLNAGYMSHSTYYKAINAIRAYNKPFDYLGKTNTDLIEKEMTEALIELSY